MKKWSPARFAWKSFYRVFRITVRETRKAEKDLLLYGTGVVRLTDDGPRHIPLEQVSFEPPAPSPQ